MPIDESQKASASKQQFHKYRKQETVRGFNYSKVAPTRLENVRLVSLSEPCMKWIGLKMPKVDQTSQASGEAKELAELLSGNKLFDGS